MKMTDKLIKKTVFLLLAAFILVSVCSCTKKENKDNNAQNNTVTDSGNTSTPAPKVDPSSVQSQSDPDSGEIPDTTVTTASPIATVSPETTDTPAVTEDIPSSSPDDETIPTDPGQERDKFDRNEYREKSYLIWLPPFSSGVFSGQNSEGTFDYATFTQVTSEEAKNYIEELKTAGFTDIISESYSSDTMVFEALNNKSWQVKLKLSDNTLILGSGFEDRESEEDKAETMYSTTMLQYLPRFTKGTYLSSDTQNDNTMYSQIIYTGVTKDDAIEYINEVKAKGYIYGVDEGDFSDSIWYMALNEESFECRVEFNGNEILIGCGYLDEE